MGFGLPATALRHRFKQARIQSLPANAVEGSTSNRHYVPSYMPSPDDIVPGRCFVLQKQVDPAGQEHRCRETVNLLLTRHGWQLLERDEFIRHTLQSLDEGIATDAYRAATNVYAHALYRACSWAEGPERQNLGYRELFRYLYDSALRRYPDLCEDATQRALERIYATFERCRQPGAFLAFAFHQLMDAVRTLRRQERPTTRSLEAPVDVDRTPLAELLPDPQQDDVARRVIDHELRVSFHRLASEFQQKHPRAVQQFAALWMKYVEGLDDKTISQKLNTSVSNVYVLRSRALKKLQAEEQWRTLAVQYGILEDDS